MASTKFKITGIRGLEVALDPVKFAKASKKALRRASGQNGLMAKAKMRKVIQTGIKPGNAELTQAIKGDDKPLVDTSELFNAITSKVTSDTEVFVGVLRRNAKAFNVGMTVHDGAAITVTPKMRGMFFYLMLASTGRMDPSKLTGRAAELFERFQDWKSLEPGTTTITISPRPFVAMAFADADLKRQAKANWQKALKQVFAERAAEGRSKG